jgi:hypothetical protein
MCPGASCAMVRGPHSFFPCDRCSRRRLVPHILTAMVVADQPVSRAEAEALLEIKMRYATRTVR